MTDYWWSYHLEKWRHSEDPIVKYLASRLYRRKLFKTIRLPADIEAAQTIIDKAVNLAKEEFNLDPKYYVLKIGDFDQPNSHYESPPLVVMDNGNLKPASDIEPIISQIIERPEAGRKWMAVPSEIKKVIGVPR